MVNTHFVFICNFLNFVSTSKMANLITFFSLMIILFLNIFQKEGHTHLTIKVTVTGRYQVILFVGGLRLKQETVIRFLALYS